MPGKLFIIKLVHTVIFAYVSACVLYVLYCGITGTYNWVLLVAIGTVFIEGLVLLRNHFQCPITVLAREHGDERGTVTDMFLPRWLAPRVFPISTVLFAIGLTWLGINYFTK